MLSAHDDLAEGNIDRAESTIRAFLQQHGIHGEGMRVMALVAAKREVLEVAEELLAQVLRRAPEHVAARSEYVSVLIRLQRYADALPHAEQVLRAHPERRDYRLLHAETLAGLNRHREVIDIHQSLLAGASDPAFHYLAVGHAHRGRAADLAIADYAQAIAARPAYGEAWWSLANLKVHRFTPEQQRALRQALDAPRLEETDRIGLHFAYAKSLEDERRFDESLEHYTQGNALKSAARSISAGRHRPYGRREQGAAHGRVLHEAGGLGTPGLCPHIHRRPAAIRLTLVEQVLASHPAIDGTMELPQINHLIQAVCSAARPGQGLRPYPSALAGLDGNAIATLGRLYLEKTRLFRTGRPHFTDKMGAEFLHVVYSSG